MKKLLHSFAGLLGLSAALSAQVSLNEIFVNPPGADNGQEFIELKSTAPSTSLNGLTLVILEGDGSNAGKIDKILTFINPSTLLPFSTGTNGLFLWRDSTAVISPAADPATPVNTVDFSPDLENGSSTYLLVTGFTGSLDQDLDGPADTDPDGVLDITPWTSVLSTIGIVENDSGAGEFNFAYAAQFGGTNLGPYVGANAFTPDAVAVTPNMGVAGADVLGTNPGGPYTFSPTENSVGFASGYTLTPGSENPAIVPEPSALLLFGAGVLSVLARRRRN